LTECGWQVEREYYFNNAGAQMIMLGNSLKARYLQVLGQKADLPENGYQGDYLITIAEALHAEVGSEWVNADWKPFKEYAETRIFKMIEHTLSRVGIQFNHFFNEQNVYDDQSVWQVLEQLREKGFIYEAVTREGADEEALEKARKENQTKPAVWFRSTALGDKEDRVVVKSNGEPTYVLPDIAYHINKLKRGFDRIVDIFGTDHIIESQTVARGLQALGYDASKIDVVLHQFVTFGDDKMSTRAGNYVTLDDLIDEVGRDAVRYFMLARSADSHLEFDFDRAKEQSNENPVYYIQNAHVRCCGIFRQVEQNGYPENWDDGADLSLLGAGELGFIRKALELPEQVVFACENLAPHQIAFWAQDLARAFHPLYDEVRVLHSEVPADVARARLRFYRMANLVFARVLSIMGMTAPERM
ncbi:MAG: arginine--tRNA ligase, partial [Anaerolineae bacterium]|nr:arginine--tRNA ligase [Anaerolineae bacterium]